jgi:hypothetical protein
MIRFIKKKINPREKKIDAKLLEKNERTTFRMF